MPGAELVCGDIAPLRFEHDAASTDAPGLMQGSEPPPFATRGAAPRSRRANQACAAPSCLRRLYALRTPAGVYPGSTRPLQDVITLTLNGVATDVDAATIAELVATLDLAGKRIAVERNGEI